MILADADRQSQEMEDGLKNGDIEKPFRLAKYFSSVAIAVIFMTCLILAAVMSGAAEKIIFDRVLEDTIMIMDNLNYQMYNHFLRPIYRERGDAKLSLPEAYSFLDTVIRNTIYGFDISRVALYDSKFGMMIYSSDSEEPVVVYKPDPETGEPRPVGQFANPMSAYLESISRAYLPPSQESIVLGGGQAPHLWRPPGASGREGYLRYLRDRTVIVRENGGYLLGGFFPRGNFAVRCFKAMEDYNSSEISGVLELTRDLTPEYKQIAAMQYLALAIAVATTIFLTFVLRLVVARGEAIITQKNTEKATLSDRLNQSERLANLGRMVATVSHEIRNPLGIIKSTADFLRSSLKENSKMALLAGAIVDESDRLSDIVTDFLDFARPQTPKFSEVLVEDILEEIFLLLEVKMINSGVELKIDFRSDPGPIPADVSMLHRAFVNLLVNAIQSMPDGGLLTVKTRLEPEGQPVWLVLEIRDTGPGLTKEAAQNIFRPFHTTKTKGTGLGLILVSNIVDSHGGRLELNNVEGSGEDDHGLVVKVSLPLTSKVTGKNA